jgi:catechol 2,3-dioxygenase-like lactoylglutathione lyase family enzyme
MKTEVKGMTPLLQVFDMPRALGFYRDILGFEVVTDSGKGDGSSWVWLRLGDSDLMLNDQYEPGHVPDAPPAERVRWHDDTCLYFGYPDVDGAYEELKDKILNIDPPKTAWYGMRQLNFKDPDGYSICFQWKADE